MFEMNKELKILKEKNRQTDIKNKELLSYLKKMTDQLNIIQEQICNKDSLKIYYHHVIYIFNQICFINIISTIYSTTTNNRIIE